MLVTDAVGTLAVLGYLFEIAGQHPGLHQRSIRFPDLKREGCESINATCKTPWCKLLCLPPGFLVWQPIPRTAPPCGPC
jgi:hypothetical protein